MIDDDLAIRHLAQIVLNTEGYEVRGASNGVEALELLGEDRPAVVILDLQMPVMDGPTFFKIIDGPGRPPVVIMSAHGAERTCRELGAEAAIAKPYNPIDLVETVNGLCS